MPASRGGVYIESCLITLLEAGSRDLAVIEVFPAQPETSGTGVEAPFVAISSDESILYEVEASWTGYAQAEKKHQCTWRIKNANKAQAQADFLWVGH